MASMKRGYSYQTGSVLFQMVQDKRNVWWRRKSDNGAGFGGWIRIFPPSVVGDYALIKLEDGSFAGLKALHREPSNLPL